MVKILKVEGFLESIKAEMSNAIESQEVQDEDFNAGRENALMYCIEMVEKHSSSDNLRDVLKNAFEAGRAIINHPDFDHIYDEYEDYEATWTE